MILYWSGIYGTVLYYILSRNKRDNTKLSLTMDVICGGLVGFFLGYFICMVLASLEAQLAAKRDKKPARSTGISWMSSNSQLTNKNCIISQLEEDKLKFAASQHLLKAEMNKLRQQYERTLSALN